MSETAAVRCLRGLLIGWILLVAPLQAQAHDGGATAFARITVSGDQSVRYSLSIPDASMRSTATALRDAGPGADSHDALARAIRSRIRLSGDSQECGAGPARAAPPSTNSISLTVTIDFACPPRMRVFSVRDDTFDVLGSDLHILALIEHNGAAQQFLLESENREAGITLDPAPGAEGPDGSTASASRFFALGIEHILTGYDHLLFLLALMIGGGSVWSLFKIVTAFTLAHSMTLTAAALDLIVLPGRLVEAAIALSIVYVALENIFLRERGHSKRWLVALAFGLVHGFGFSSVLKELGLPADGLVWTLLLFNLGVEAGQALVIAASIPLLVCLRRAAWRLQAIGVASGAVLAVGVVLVVDRAFFW